MSEQISSNECAEVVGEIKAFGLRADHARTLEMAMHLARGVTGYKSDSAALGFLAGHYLAQQLASESPQVFLKTLELAMGLKLKAFDPEDGVMVYGHDHEEECAVMSGEPRLYPGDDDDEYIPF